jgi:hypothetical protein
MELNSKSENGIYLNIKQITNTHIILDILNSDKYISFTTNAIPSEYYGDVTASQEEYRGYTIVKYGDTY